jgi:SAM-dependent methyltransferase
MAARTDAEVEEAARATLADYGAVAEGYAAGNMDHDVRQNIDALLAPLLADDPARKLDILDVACASGRDLRAFSRMGHRAVGLDGVPAFCDMSRSLCAEWGCEVWQQSLTSLELPAARFDGIFANACLFHIPSAALPGALAALRGALRPGGVLFSSNAHGFGEDREGWTAGRTPGTRSYVCWLSEASWVRCCEDAGLELLDSYYRPPGKAREQQPFLATVWRRPLCDQGAGVD